jgi:uncharacterized protein YjiS (DUF1127 family)
MEDAMTTVSLSHTPIARWGSTFGALLASPLIWITRARQRRELMGLLGQSQHVLQDIGLRRDEITREGLKPFWKA